MMNAIPYITYAMIFLCAGCALYVFVTAKKWSESRSRKDRAKLLRGIALLLLVFVITLSVNHLSQNETEQETAVFSEADIPEYEGSPFTPVHGNMPFFTKAELSAEPYAFYSELDQYGRCGYAMAMIDRAMMPKEDRGEIESVKPSGYHNAVYEDLIEDGFLYNRCHLIGYQFTGENANEKNLITGTRYMNVEGMEPFENAAASCVRRTKMHVLLRVTPVFKGKELVARGVLLEAYSVEDQGKEICFCVYCHNVQPGIVINYADGTSHRQ